MYFVSHDFIHILSIQGIAKYKTPVLIYCEKIHFNLNVNVNEI